MAQEENKRLIMACLCLNVEDVGKAIGDGADINVAETISNINCSPIGEVFKTLFKSANQNVDGHYQHNLGRVRAILPFIKACNEQRKKEVADEISKKICGLLSPDPEFPEITEEMRKKRMEDIFKVAKEAEIPLDKLQELITQAIEKYRGIEEGVRAAFKAFHAVTHGIVTVDQIMTDVNQAYQEQIEGLDEHQIIQSGQSISSNAASHFLEAHKEYGGFELLNAENYDPPKDKPKPSDEQLVTWMQQSLYAYILTALVVHGVTKTEGGFIEQYKIALEILGQVREPGLQVEGVVANPYEGPAAAAAASAAGYER